MLYGIMQLHDKIRRYSLIDNPAGGHDWAPQVAHEQSLGRRQARGLRFANRCLTR